jgi:hypothetical protein
VAKVDPTAPAPAKTASDRRQSAAASYGKLPLSFEANHGQTDPEVQFLSRGSGYSLFLTGKGAVLALGTAANPGKPKSPARPQEIIHMTLLGQASQHPSLHPIQAAGEDPLPGKVNYFLGSDPTQWHTGLPTYAKVRYSSVYPGIDLVYYGNQRQLEYDFIVAPGAKPSDIRFHLTGARHLRIAANGDLLLGGSNIQPAFQKPVIYQETNGQRQIVPGSFRLLAANTIGFTLGSYDHTRPLIIDPVLVYSTYLGGTGTSFFQGLIGDQGNGIAADSLGNAYVVGTTWSKDFPITGAAYQKKNKVASSDWGGTVFITKFNAAGTALVYSTFLGGSGFNLDYSSPGNDSGGGDYGYAIALDSANNAYVTGRTYSSDFPITTGAYQSTNKGVATFSANAFVTKLNPAGNALVYSTYLSGSGLGLYVQEASVGQAIAVDSAGSAYVTGYVESSDFPVTPGAFQTQHPAAGLNGTPNAFVTKLTPDGKNLDYSTYLGGTGNGSGYQGDIGNAIAVDASGNAYVTGQTYSADFPVTTGAFQTVNHGFALQLSNAFVTKLNPTGTAEVYSTYLGGSGHVYVLYTNQYPGDIASAIALDSEDNAYIAGVTGSADFPILGGLHMPLDPGYQTGFVTKLNASGSALVYSTYLGGDLAQANGLAVDDSGVAYVSGVATNLPDSPDALEQTGGVFVAKLVEDATAIDYATALGGSPGARIPLAIDPAGNAYITGADFGLGYFVSSNAYQSANKLGNGASNAVVTKLALAGETTPHYQVAVSISPSASLYKVGQLVTLTAKVTGPAQLPVPTGQVTFSGYFNNYPVPGLPASETLNSSGVATWTSTTLPPALYEGILANYGGDGSHLTGSLPYIPSFQSGATFRVVGPPAAIVSPGSQYYLFGYGTESNIAFSAVVTDSAGYGLAGQTVNFSGVGLRFNPSSAVTNAHGLATSYFTATQAGNTIAIASTNGVATPLTDPVDIVPAPLTVTIHGNYRSYGTANPIFPVTLSGLVTGDTVTVTPQTTATISSPVGTYPVTATVTGASASNYSITLIGSVLNVEKAPLHIVAAALPIVYGHTPPQPIAYHLTGFLNGDTASVVTGAPALSTTVTATTPVGFYPITVQPGTLSATNYNFLTTSNGSGYVGVYKAPITVTANTLTMTAGSPVPPLTYTLTGFLNGDTASTVSGAPILTTSATSTSPPGTYGITVKVGNLSAANYGFVPVENVGVVHVVK